MRCSCNGQKKIVQTLLKAIYMEIGKAVIAVKKPPSIEEVQTFWENILNTPNEYHAMQSISNKSKKE